MKSSKRAVCLFVSLVLCFSAVLTGCSSSDSGENQSSVVVSAEQSSEQQSEQSSEPSTEQSSEQPSEQPSETTESSVESTQNSAETSSKAPTESSQEQSKEPDPQPEIPDVDDNFFSRTAFLGNSRTMGLDEYKIITKADFYCKEGLTVYGVLHETLPKQKLTVIEQLIKNKKKYDKVFLMFGTNETGLYDKSDFIEDYEKIIDIMQEKMPEVKIYIQSIIPITEAKSKKNTYDLNNEQINEYNKQLQELAKEKNVPYLDVASVFKNKNGTLPESWSPDGVHLNPNYYYLWADYLENNAK